MFPGCFSRPKHMKSGLWGKEDALSVKTSIPTPKMDSELDCYYTLNFLIKSLKNGLILWEKIFFSKLDETLGGPSTCPYDSIQMHSMFINIESEVLITS